MPYTDIWRCKRCNTLPDIVMMGKNYLIECKVCKEAAPVVYAKTLQGVVSRWNRLNNPVKRGIFTRLIEWIIILKDALEYYIKRGRKTR
jgi:hypothetical protein